MLTQTRIAERSLTRAQLRSGAQRDIRAQFYKIWAVTMLFENFDLEINPVFASLIFGALLGLVFGVSAQISRFCLRRGLVKGSDRKSALGVWLFALAFATLGTQVARSAGLIELEGHRFATGAVPALAAILGGLAFGVGMVLTRGCVSRLTVLASGGNLRAVFVLVAFAITAHATLKGVLAPLRVFIGSETVDLGDAALATNWVGGGTLWAAALIVLCLAFVFRSGARPAHLALAALIGTLVPLGWVGTGVLLFDDFDPIPLATMSFTAPWADTLFWTIASTSIPAGFGTGLLVGVIAGAFLSALIRRETKLESFESPEQTIRYISGGALMGFGGVLAGGCTVGAGLSGVSALSVVALLALGAMMIGALATDRLLDQTRIRRQSSNSVPAE